MNHWDKAMLQLIGLLVFMIVGGVIMVAILSHDSEKSIDRCEQAGGTWINYSCYTGVKQIG